LIPFNPEEQQDQTHVVLSQDTSLVLELSFKPGPDHTLAFDALEIPHTHFISRTFDGKPQRLLSLQIVLVDAVTDVYIQARAQDQQHEETILPLLVKFETEYNIIDLQDGKAIVRFKLPCCLLDSMHRTGRYR